MSCAPRALARREHRPVGGHDAPRHPAAAVEEPVEVAGDVGERGCDRDRQHRRVRRRAARRRRRRRSSARRRWPRPTPTPSRSTACRSPGRGRSGSPGSISSPNHGSSSHTIWGDCGSARRRRPRQIAATWERTARAATANATLVGHAGAGQRHAERDRPDELPLDRAGRTRRRRRRAGTPACPPKASSARSVCTGAHGSMRIRRRRRGCRTGPTRDAGDADERLGDHALGRRCGAAATGSPARRTRERANAGGLVRPTGAAGCRRRWTPPHAAMSRQGRRGPADATSSPVEAADHRADRRRSRGPV